VQLCGFSAELCATALPPKQIITQSFTEKKKVSQSFTKFKKKTFFAELCVTALPPKQIINKVSQSFTISFFTDFLIIT
jgi:hypothetical protein